MNNFTFLEPDVESVPYLDLSVFLHQTKDGWIATMPSRFEIFGSFRATDRAHLADDERFADQTSRARHRDELRKLLDGAYIQFTTQELSERFELEDVPYSLINDRAEVIDDPQVEAMDALLTYDHPRAGLVRTPRPAHNMLRRRAISAPIHRAGEHTGAILTELGYEPAQIESFLANQVVLATQQPTPDA